jgi:uncharacterized HhH-GPD family protein
MSDIPWREECSSRPTTYAEGVAEQKPLVAAILQHSQTLAATAKTGVNGVLTADSDANRLLVEDSFAFLVGVIVDYQMPAERAWSLPCRLKARLDGWGPSYLAANPQEVHAAFQRSPKLHRFPNQTPRFVVAGAQQVLEDYAGDAGTIWSDSPTASLLQERLREFSGISQKKAAMTVEILVRDLGVDVLEMSGSDIAYDVHVRRVMLRTGLAKTDNVVHMVEVARTLHPTRPGELDFPLWDIGKRWCHKQNPQCSACTLENVCSQDITAGDGVHGA